MPASAQAGAPESPRRAMATYVIDPQASRATSAEREEGGKKCHFEIPQKHRAPNTLAPDRAPHSFIAFIHCRPSFELNLLECLRESEPSLCQQDAGWRLRNCITRTT